MSRESRAAALVILAACGFGTISIVVTLADGAGVTLNTMMAWRYALAAPLLVLAAGGLARMRVAPGRALALILLGGVGQTLVTWLSLSSLAWISAATLGFLFYTYPAFVALFAAISGTERLTAARAGALAIALAGITLMVGSPWSSPMPLEGVLRALGSAVAYALYIPLLHRLRGPLDARVAAAYVILGAALLFLGVGASQGLLLQGMTATTWMLALVLSVFSTGIAFVAFMRGLEVLGAVRTAILSTVEPFYTALLGALVLAQGVGPATIVGGACIIVAIVLLQRTPRPALPDAPPPD